MIDGVHDLEILNVSESELIDFYAEMALVGDVDEVEIGFGYEYDVLYNEHLVLDVVVVRTFLSCGDSLTVNAFLVLYPSISMKIGNLVDYNDLCSIVDQHSFSNYFHRSLASLLPPPSPVWPATFQ